MGTSWPNFESSTPILPEILAQSSSIIDPMTQIPTPANPPVDPNALAAYLKTLDFQAGQRVTHASHHQGEVRLFEPNHPDLPAKLIIKRPFLKTTERQQGLRLGREIKRWLSLYTLKREHSAYQRLDQVSGTPTCFGLFFETYLVLEFIDGQPLSETSNTDPSVFGHLRDTIDAMHAAGVAHGDLKRQDNILITPQGAPKVIDLGTALTKKTGFHPINHWLFAFLAQTDRNAWVKHKYSGYAGVDHEDAGYLKRSWLERVLSYWRSRNRANP